MKLIISTRLYLLMHAAFGLLLGGVLVISPFELSLVFGVILFFLVVTDLSVSYYRSRRHFAGAILWSGAFLAICVIAALLPLKPLDHRIGLESSLTTLGQLHQAQIIRISEADWMEFNRLSQISIPLPSNRPTRREIFNAVGKLHDMRISHSTTCPSGSTILFGSDTSPMLYLEAISPVTFLK